MTRRPFALQILLTLACAVLFSSCAKTPESSTNVAATPTPELKMEGQSPNWKVVVVSVDQVPKQDPMFDPTGVPDQGGPDTKYDTLQLTVDLSYSGAAQDVQSPTAALIDSTGRRVEAVKTALETLGMIHTISFGPGYSSLRTLFTGEAAPTPNEAEKEQEEKRVKELLQWLDPESTATYNKKPRALKAGEQFKVIYFFQDPKDYSNLKLAFNDVPPIALRPPKVEASPTPSSPAAQTATPVEEFRIDAQNNNWKLMVTSIKKVPNDTTREHDPRDSLEVGLDVEYAGPVRGLKPPTATLIDGKGMKYAGDINRTSVMEWVFPGSPDIALKPGTRITVTFSFKDPVDYTDIKLVFNDVPAFPLRAP